MSLNEESDDEFESADEGIDFDEPIPPKQLETKVSDEIQSKTNDEQTDQISANIDKQLTITSTQEIKSIPLSEEKASDLKSEEPIIPNTNEVKTLIKGRKILRISDRLKEEIEETIWSKTEENISNISDKSDISDKLNISHKLDISDKQNISHKPDISYKSTDIVYESNYIDDQKEKKTDIKKELTPSVVSSEELLEKFDENQTKEVKNVILGRKIVRKSDRLKEEMTPNESEISEQKKIEVLNKLSDLGQSDDTSAKWNNWFTDIKSAAMTATSTTVSHVSQASNKWSLNPKSLLSSAVSITSNVGSGITSVVENVTSVVDSAIGAPPPEQMAALSVNKDSENKFNVKEKEPPIDENQSKTGLGFGFFNYSLNALESIGKKTMEVIVEDKPKKEPKTNKLD